MKEGIKNARGWAEMKEESGQKWNSEEGDHGEKEGVGRNEGVKEEIKERRRGWVEMKDRVKKEMKERRRGWAERSEGGVGGRGVGGNEGVKEEGMDGNEGEIEGDEGEKEGVDRNERVKEGGWRK